ncbi:hypothetical protein CK203_023280 [Vitis vinifera]|uniref:Uncharacterized protein n=1 Tax=Vitis vinifera TaxID=29760 RepID=A0A438J1M0_VITVI|nr:hypothetical protein CK203_023280 [Vitis vinifera]
MVSAKFRRCTRRSAKFLCSKRLIPHLYEVGFHLVVFGFHRGVKLQGKSKALLEQSSSKGYNFLISAPNPFAGTTHSITFPLPTSHDFHFQRWDLRRRKFRSPGFKCVGGLGKTHRNHHWSENKDFSHPFLGILYNLVIWGKQTHGGSGDQGMLTT